MDHSTSDVYLISLRVGVVTAIAAVLAACSSNGKMTAQPATCDHSGRDSVFAVGGPVYRECAVDRPAKLLTADIHPAFNPTDTRPRCYSASVEFVVDSMGKPEQATARLLKANDNDLAAAMLAVLKLWRYDPATLDGRHVRQIVTVSRTASVGRVVLSPGQSRPSEPPRDMRPAC